MKYKIFIVSIERNKSRQADQKRELLTQGFSEEDFIVVNGLDYKNVSTKELDLIKSSWAIFTPSPVLACAYSHFKVWELIKNDYKDLDFAIILEDDAYLIKSEFMKYQDEIYKILQDNPNYFINNSTDYSFMKINDPTKIINEVHFSFGANTYFIHPSLAENLFNYFVKHKFSYHIDLHFGFMKDEIKMKIFLLTPILFNPINKSKSSMVSNHQKKFILKYLLERKGPFSFDYFNETYKNINTPVIQTGPNAIPITAYIMFVFVSFIILLIITYRFYDLIVDNNIVFIFISILWIIIGLSIRDVY